MADVDEIWREMQREQPKISEKRAAVKAVQDLSLLQREKPKQKKTASKRLDSTLNLREWSTNLVVGQKQNWDFGVSAMADIVEDLAVAAPPTTMLDAWEDVPTGTPETFLAYLQRDINCLAEEAMSVRLQSLQKLERILVAQIDSLATDVVDAVFDAMLKPLLKRLKDKSEKCRELAVKILRSLVENTSDLAAALPYIFPTLVSRLGCEDLDGVAHLPEIMRPDPEQKPTEIARPVEDSEEVRVELGHFIASLLQRCSPIQIYSYIDEATGLIRAQAMDPFHGVKALACETMVTFCYNNREMLLHFALPLARSLTSCLTHNHAKLRIAGLRAITACLFCGVWKHNFEIFEVLMAWQDPNKVPIKAFYEGVTNVNYMSTLSFDRHPAVRRFWFETLAYWMLRCVDKVDLEPYIAPYLLTGLCDENEEIALEVFWLIERIGEAYEAEHEEDLRKTKQYGFDFSWTYGGRAFVPFPLQGVWGGGTFVPRHIRRAGAQGPDFLGHRPLLAHQHREHGIFMSFWAFAGFSVDRVVKDRRACRQIRGVRKVSSEFALGLCFRCFQAVKRHASCTFPAPSDTQVVAAAGTLLVDHPLYLYENVKNLKTHNCRVILRGLHLGQQTTSLKSANDRTRPALVNANPVPMGTGESR
ncbi:Dnaaf5 [Symbiodinium natans]|uniref:Dnaaf5 protein n=1 Tax=Symbiodinium natans TaxID=878477 RepID=A0A812U545_9DINO|nr:Dnaaf5 [Symbiodinium natans]